MDIFPVAVCDNIRIANSKIVAWQAGLDEAVFLWREVRALTTATGITVVFCFVLGCESDVQAFRKLPLSVAPESSIYADNAYTDYGEEEDLMDAEMIRMMVSRKSNSKRKDEP